MIPQDYHIHSHHSVDSEASIEEMCRGALAAGIPEIGFAEHFDLHPRDPARDWFRLEMWAAELEECRKAMDGRVLIRAGIEIGEPHLYGAEVHDLLDRYPFDYVIGSLHWIGDDFLFDPAYFDRPAEEAFGIYFRELGRMIDGGELDIAGHLDVPARLSTAHYGDYDPGVFEKAIRPVLRKCIDRGIALDINTSAVRRGVNVLTPGMEILTWFREMGGERITLGSDAHRPEDVGAHLDRACAAVLGAGLRHVTRFERRQARLVPLIGIGGTGYSTPEFPGA